MIDYQKDVRISMDRAVRLISAAMRSAVEKRDLDQFEDKIEGCFDMIRQIAKRVRDAVAEDMVI